MPFFDLKKRLAADLAAHVNVAGVTAAGIEADLGTPPQPTLGHIALPCFKLSKLLGKPSDEVARDFAANFSQTGMTVTPTGPYANFKWDPLSLYARTLTAIFEQGARYGADESGRGRTIVVEFCSPNVAKKMGFLHVRSTLIGNSLSNVYEFFGTQTERMNFVGDWGSQFARLLSAFEKWGDRARLSLRNVAGAMDHLSEVYVKYHKEIEGHPDLGELASKALQRLEQHETRATDLWKEIRAISISAMQNTLKKLNVRFNHVEGESLYVPEIQRVVEEVKTKAGAKISEGAWIVEVPDVAAPAVVQKKDGTTLYLTRDIAAAIDRHKRFSFDKMFYIVAEQQRLHFQLLFGVLKLMGYRWADDCEHISFGTVLFESERASTREGRGVFLDELLAEAKQLALIECTRKTPELSNKEKVAEQVGIGALVFGSLSEVRRVDIEFKWENVIAIDGATGPYVQYSLVTCQSLLEKARAKGEKIGWAAPPAGYEFSPEEEILVLTLAKFRHVLHLVVRDNEPSHLTHYLIDLAKAFNRFYYKLPVLQSAEEGQRRLRISLVAGTLQTLQNGLGLLGIDSPKEM